MNFVVDNGDIARNLEFFGHRVDSFEGCLLWNIRFVGGIASLVEHIVGGTASLVEHTVFQ